MAKLLWTLVGADTLVGRELRELVEERKLPVVLRILSGSEAVAVFTAEDDEAAVMEPISAETLADAQVVFLCGPVESSRQALAAAHSAGLLPVWVDLTGELENLPQSRLRAPMIESELLVAAPGSIEVIAHPAAAILGRFLALLHHSASIQRAVVTICEPVSAHGRPAIDEMHKQMVSLLSFQSMPQDLFGVQVAFNLMPRFGPEAKVTLEASEHRIEQHLVSLLSPVHVPLPSIRLIHAPVFHGYVFSAWVEFNARPTLEAVQAIFTATGIDLRTSEHEPASNLGVAGQSGFTVSDIIEDRNDPRAAWFFVVADNLRTTAENAVMVAGMAGGEN